MKKDLLSIYVSQVEGQCANLQIGARMLQAAFEAMHAANQVDREAQDHLWAGCQLFVTSAANLSKLFWGSGGRKSEPRAPLRQILDVPDDSPLRDVSMRNHFDHIDERIDRWAASTTPRSYIDRYVGPESGFSGVEADEIFRMFDPTTGDLVFWGERYALQPIFDEASRVLLRAQKLNNDPWGRGWEPVPNNGSSNDE